MANMQLAEDYKKYFNEIGDAYDLDKAEVDILRGVYEKVAKQIAEQIRERIADLKYAYEDYKTEYNMSDEEMARAINIEIRRFMIARRRRQIEMFAAACEAAIEKYDLSIEECEVLRKYRMARFAEMIEEVRERFAERTENFQELIERYDLQEEDFIKLVAAVVAANIML